MDLVNDGGFVFVAGAFQSVSQVMICGYDFSVVYRSGVDCTDNEDFGLADSLSVAAVHKYLCTLERYQDSRGIS
jgi:hypothetical protein